ncbi:MAG: GNAT family N-acetyltransferase [Pseudomonadota bacterium]
MAERAARIEIAERADEAALAAVLNEAFAALAPSLGYRPGPMDRDYSSLLEQGFVLKLCDDHDQPIGFAVTLPRATHLYVEAIAVRPGAQGVGFGALLLAEVEELASELCLPRLRLHTDPSLNRPMRFYRAAGYRELGRQGFGSARRALFEKRTPTALELLLGRMIDD